MFFFVLSIGPEHKSPHAPDTWVARVSGFLLFRTASGLSSATEAEHIVVAQALLGMVIVLRLRRPHSGIGAALLCLRQWRANRSSSVAPKRQALTVLPFD